MTVTDRALVARINRKLPDLQKVRTAREGGWMRVNFGRHYLFDFRTNGVTRSHVDLVALARSLGVMAADEFSATV